MVQTDNRVVLGLSPKAKVLQTLRQWLADGTLAKGEPVPAERALASQLEVARGTVRTALNELTDEGLIISRKGCVRRVAGKSTTPPVNPLIADAFAVLNAGTYTAAEISNPNLEDAFVRGHAVKNLEDAGYHVISVNPDRLFASGAASAADLPSRGLLIPSGIAGRPETVDLARELVSNGVPVVVLDEQSDYDFCDRVCADHEAGAYALTSWLIEQGCRWILRFWCVTGKPAWIESRDRGVVQALEEHGLEPLPPLWIHDLKEVGSDRDGFVRHSKACAGHLAEYLTAENPPDAVLTVTDAQAYWVSAACRLLHAVPNQDLLIAGYDNRWAVSDEIQFESTGPAVTVDKDNLGLAGRAAQVLLERAAGERTCPPEEILWKPKLVVPGDQR